MTYTTRGSFLVAAGATTTETFNGAVAEDSFQTMPIDFGAFSVAGFGRQFDRNLVDIPPHMFGVFNIDGTTNLNCVTATDTGLTFTFDSPIMAWGADFGGYIQSFITAAGETVVPLRPRTGISFYGFVSDTPFTTVRFHGFDAAEGFSIDNVTWAAAGVRVVPEPASATMMLLGLGIAGAVRRKRIQTIA